MGSFWPMVIYSSLLGSNRCLRPGRNCSFVRNGKNTGSKVFLPEACRDIPSAGEAWSFPRKAERTDSQQLVLKPTIRATLHFDGYYAPTAIAWDSSEKYWAKWQVCSPKHLSLCSIFSTLVPSWDSRALQVIAFACPRIYIVRLDHLLLHISAQLAQ